MTMKEFGELFRAKHLGLALPRDFEDHVNRLVQTHSSERESVERRPFRRKIDFWAFCIATALAKRLDPSAGAKSGEGQVFVYSSQGVMSDDLCSLLAVIAVGRLGHDDAAALDVKGIIDLSNRLAFVGCPVVIKRLTENALTTTPLDQLLEFSRSLQDGGMPDRRP